MQWAFFSSVARILRSFVGAASGTGDQFSDSIDTSGFGCVAFSGHLGTADPGNSIFFQVADVEGGPFADTGLSVTPAANDQQFLIEAAEPKKRWVRLRVSRAVATTIGEVWCALSKSSQEPPGLDSSVAHGSAFSPEVPS